MSSTPGTAIRVAGGSPSWVAAVEAALAAADSAPKNHALIDLGLPPRDWPAGEALIDAEVRRARDVAEQLSAGERWVRVSLLGASPTARVVRKRAQGEVELLLAERTPQAVVLRAGLILEEGGVCGAMRRALQRAPLQPFPAFGRARLEPLALPDLARYVVAAALGDGPYADRYDLGCGEFLTGGLLAKGLADHLGVRRLLVPVPRFADCWLAPFWADVEYPTAALCHEFEALRDGLTSRRMTAWDDFPVKPVELREALAAAAGMILVPRREGADRFGTWQKPQRTGILWRKGRRR